MIRPGEASDWNAIVEVYDTAKPDELRAAGIDGVVPSLRDDEVARAGLKDFSVLVFTEDDGRVVGFGGYKDDHIGWLFVHRERRHQGIGRALLRAMLEQIPKKAVWLWVLPGNSAAFALYTREGFRMSDGARVKIHDRTCIALKLVRECGELFAPKKR